MLALDEQLVAVEWRRTLVRKRLPDVVHLAERCEARWVRRHEAASMFGDLLELVGLQATAWLNDVAVVVCSGLLTTLGWWLVDGDQALGDLVALMTALINGVVVLAHDD